MGIDHYGDMQRGRRQSRISRNCQEPILVDQEKPASGGSPASYASAAFIIPAPDQMLAKCSPGCTPAPADLPGWKLSFFEKMVNLTRGTVNSLRNGRSTPKDV
jgi:hypothetical protein